MNNSNTIQIEDINSSSIRRQAAVDGITEVQLLAESGKGDHKVTVYAFGSVRVADTNGDPVWEDSEPSEFAELLEEAGINL